MGVVGEWVSNFRRSGNDDPVYECHQCGNQFEIRYHQCPDCGGYRIERTNWEL